jgi:hypothetical protein
VGPWFEEKLRTWYYGLRAVVCGSITHTVCDAEYPHGVWSTVEATFEVTLVLRMSGDGLLMIGGRRRSGGGGVGVEEESSRCLYRSESGRVVLRKLVR